MKPVIKKPIKKGKLSTQASLTKKEKGKQTVLKDETQTKHIDTNGDVSASVGLSMGLTIPGPKGSFASARIDVSVSIPCGAGDADVKNAYIRAGNLVQDELESSSQQIIEFFKVL